MKITKEDIRIMNKKVSRDIQIELNMNFNRHRVHNSKKAYNRKREKNITNYEN